MLRPTGDVGGEVPGIDIRHSGDKGRRQQSETLTKTPTSSQPLERARLEKDSRPHGRPVAALDLRLGASLTPMPPRALRLA